jgi:hypothetical protein
VFHGTGLSDLNHAIYIRIAFARRVANHPFTHKDAAWRESYSRAGIVRLSVKGCPEEGTKKKNPRGKVILITA